MAKQKKKVDQPRIPKPEIVQGIIRLHPRGFGFLLPEGKRGPKEEIFIPKHLTLHAVDGDRVEVAVKPEISPKGKEGKVLSVLERGRTHLAGTVYQVDKEGRPLVYVPILGSDSRVALEEGEANVGDRVVIEILSWGERGGVTAGRLKEIIGTIESPADDVKAAVEEYSLSREFPELVISSLKNLGNKIKPSEKKGRENLTKLPTITIDPDTAKDFDDALSIEKRENGTFYLAVHVADVSYYVRPGTAVDEEARRRLNSTYFPGTCIPMLPEVLSNELCSLKPHVNRLAATIHMEFSPTGEMTSYRVSRSVIKSAHRFTYKEARKVLDGKKKSPFLKMLQDMRDLALLLKSIRKGRGSIELSLPDLFVRVDDKGNPLGVELEEYDITHQLVEEFMLKANEVVATHIADLGKPLTYRIHDSPDMEDIEEFVRLVRSFDLIVPDQPTPKDIQEAINNAASTPFASFVVGSYIRSMKLAVYSSDNIGHHGLALEHYCHFTSPIRRYPDLVVHRLLFGGDAELEEIDRVADMASTQERVSAKAEQSVKLLKKLRLLKVAPPKKEFIAYVSRVKPFGFAFEVVEMGMEGFFGFENLGDDYYFYDEKKRSLEGRRTNESYYVGKQISVALQEIDLIFLEAKWYLITETPRSGDKKKKRRRR